MLTGQNNSMIFEISPNKIGSVRTPVKIMTEIKRTILVINSNTQFVVEDLKGNPKFTSRLFIRVRKWRNKESTKMLVLEKNNRGC